MGLSTEAAVHCDAHARGIGEIYKLQCEIDIRSGFEGRLVSEGNAMPLARSASRRNSSTYIDGLQCGRARFRVEAEPGPIPNDVLQYAYMLARSGRTTIR